MTERLTYSVEETAQLLGISRSAAWKYVHAGEIPHIKVGERYLVPKAALEAWLASAFRSGESAA